MTRQTGKPLPHDAGPLHVAGTARYIDDIPTPGNTLHLAFGLSGVAHGDITALDLEAVKSAAGVVQVLIAADLPFENDVSPVAHDEPLLATGTVHYVGQPVFLVVANSHLAARKAARLASIEYTGKTPIFSIGDALAANSSYDDAVVWQKGEAAYALKHAKHTLSGRIEMGGQEHFYLESQAALAFPQEGGDMLVHSSTQHPTEIQHKVAHALGVPMNAVRVETRRMGGGFGGKESQGNALAVACAIVANRTGRPCKMRYDRDDDMTITGKRHDFRIDYTAGYDDDGRISGLEFTHYTRCGWALDLSHPVADRAMLHADNAYHLEDVKITSHRLRTNTQSATAYRGFGGPQGILGIERVIEHIAGETGLDPLTVRRNNFYAPRGTSAKSRKAPQTTPYGQQVTDFILDGLVDQLAQSSDYAARRTAIARWNAENPVLKKGIALTPVKFGISFTLTFLNQAGALVHIYQDGSIHLNHGGTEMGQGLFQKLAQVAATVFGVDTSLVKITATDTAKVPNTSATAASSGSDLNGMAVKNACDTIKARITAFLAEQVGVDPANVSFENGMVMAGRRQFTFAKVAQLAYESRISLSSTGFYKTPKISWDRIRGKGRPFLYFSYGAAVTEVVIDTLTGENRILRADILHDAGTSLNPDLDIGQVEGAYVQGAGWLTTEELVHDSAGCLRTHAPGTYKIPACSDRPDIFNVALWDGANTEDTIFRSKAVGEPPFVHGISAFMALADAVGACGPGTPLVDAPATPERILAAVNTQRDTKHEP
jgi:xanthine dehydrogenase large subunit